LVKSLFRTKLFLVGDLISMKLTREYAAPAHQYISLLHLQFRGKTLVISELTIAYYVEHLHRTLEYHYLLADDECEY